MRYIDVLIMNAGLMDVSAPSMKSRFSYAVSRNKRILEPVIKSLNELIDPSEDHKKFTEERQKLLKEYAKKDEDGNPIIQTTIVRGQQVQNYSIPGVNDETNDFNKKFDAIKKKYKAAIDEQETKEKEYEKYLETETEEIPLIMVEWKLVPETGLSQKAMDGVIFMIKEDSEEEKPATKKKK